MPGPPVSGFFGLGDKPETIYFAGALWVAEMVIFSLLITGCLTVPMRFFYIAKCGQNSFGYAGICAFDGANCTASLVKPALEVAFDIGSQENICQILKNLQNDTSFILPVFSLFSHAVCIFWLTVIDRGEKTETTTYFVWPIMIMWSAVGWSWTAAWNASFNGSLLVDARTGCTQGTLLAGLLWVIFLLTAVSGVTLIHFAFVVHHNSVANAKKLWKAKYLHMMTPKDKIIQDIVTPFGRVDGSTQRVQTDALRWNV